MSKDITHYQIIAPLDAGDYNKDEDIFDSSLPCWIKKEMIKIAKREGVNIRDLSFKREISWSDGDLRWIDSVEIIK